MLRRTPLFRFHFDLICLLGLVFRVCFFVIQFLILLFVGIGLCPCFLPLSLFCVFAFAPLLFPLLFDPFL